jgi:hypothetical protein
VAAVSPIIEISECTRALERPGNCLYQWNFVRDLKRRDAAQERCQPGALRPLAAGRDQDRARQFDEAYHRPYSSASATPRTITTARSAMRVIERVRVPALVITAGRRSVRAVGAVSRSEVDRQPCIDCGSARTAATAVSSARERRAGDGYWAEDRNRGFSLLDENLLYVVKSWTTRVPGRCKSSARNHLGMCIRGTRLRFALALAGRDAAPLTVLGDLVHNPEVPGDPAREGHRRRP